MLSDTPGVHHVSIIAGDPRRNRRFYAEVLGLRFVLRTVNFEDQFTYHLYYGDERGSPGTVLTFFAYPREEPGRTGRPGIASTSLRIPADSLDYWRDRLAARGVDHDPPTERFGETVLPLRDPDGTSLELVATDEGGVDARPWSDGPVPKSHTIRGVRGVSMRSSSPYVTASLLETLGFDLVAEAGSRVRYRLPSGRRTVVDLLTDDAPYGREGQGTIHHVALSVESEAQLREWRDLLIEREFDVSRVKDRHFFRSLYVRDEGGVLFELCTEDPGLGVSDHEPDPAGDLRLPPWLEEDREMIVPQLPPLEDEESGDGDDGARS